MVLCHLTVFLGGVFQMVRPYADNVPVSPSSQVVPHSLRIAIWTSVHREDGFISVAINDRLELFFIAQPPEWHHIGQPEEPF